MEKNPDNNITSDKDELYEHHRFTVDKGQSAIRIDKFLVDRIENASRSKIQDAASAGNILINSKPVKSNYKIKPGDIVSIVLAYPPREIEIIPEPIPLNIVFEDESIVIINKPPGMVVHPSYGHYTGTLVNALAYYLKSVENFRDPGDIRPGLVHRIDKDTSGLLMIAKDEETKNKLSKQFFDHTIERKYVALVWGAPKTREGTITGHIGRSLKDRKKMDVFEDGEFGKHAVTHYSVIENLGYISCVECRLETGRTHQIRAHMKFIGHPVFNDQTYGGDQILKGTTFSKYKQFVKNCFSLLPRQALHAKTLGFEHPKSKKQMFFNSDMPDDMNTVINKWRTYTSNRDIE